VIAPTASVADAQPENIRKGVFTMRQNKAVAGSIRGISLVLCAFSMTAVMADPPRSAAQQRHYKPVSTNQEEIIAVTPLQGNQECIVSNDGTYPASISLPCVFNVDTSRYDPLFFELEAEAFTPDFGGIISVSDNDQPLDVYPNLTIPAVDNWSKWKTRSATLQVKDAYHFTVTVLPNYSNLLKAKNIVVRLHIMPKS
jgi:hypothetical protein